MLAASKNTITPERGSRVALLPNVGFGRAS
jgi:hypothetical protein